LKVDGEEAFGVQVVKRALEEPARQIANNAGSEGSVVVERLKSENGSFGFNAETETYEDLTKAGIIDPAKVTRLALQNAASIAGLLLTTDVVVTEKPKKKKSAKVPEQY
jgi:chaperonin GroEL